MSDQANSYWYDGDKLLIYIALGDFARHLVERHKTNQVAEFKETFLAVEKLYSDGDDFVKEAVTVGLLEGIQNISGNAGIDPKVFEPYLAPASKKWWDKLNDFWSAKSTLK